MIRWLSIAALAIGTALSAFPTLADSPKTQCQSLFDEAENASKEFFDYPRRIASDSAPITLATAAAALTATQVVRHVFFGDPQDPIFTRTFLITLPVDGLLTVVSHMIALGHIPALKKLAEGQTFGERFEFLTRTGTNVVLGTTVIAANWLAFGVPVTPSTVCGAAALCAAVYPVLQTLKNALFKWFPSRSDRRRVEQLQADEGFAEFESLREAALARARDLGVKPEQAEAMLLGYWEGVVTSHPYEDAIVESAFLKSEPRVQRLVQTIKVAKEKHQDLTPDASVKQTKKLMKLRRDLLSVLLSLEDNSETDDALRTEILSVLKISAAHSEAFSLRFHQSLDQRARRYWWNLVGASLIDQTVSVGVAGGVFLYAVNHWAATGETPWFLIWW